AGDADGRAEGVEDQLRLAEVARDALDLDDPDRDRTGGAAGARGGVELPREVGRAAPGRRLRGLGHAVGRDEGDLDDVGRDGVADGDPAEATVEPVVRYGGCV